MVAMLVHAGKLLDPAMIPNGYAFLVKISSWPMVALAHVWDVDLSKPTEARDYRPPRLEAFLGGGSRIPNASSAARATSYNLRMLAELLSAEPPIVAEEGGRGCCCWCLRVRES